MQLIYNLVGWLVFRRQQMWEQRRNGKILVLTVAFSLALKYRFPKVTRPFSLVTQHLRRIFQHFWLVCSHLRQKRPPA